MLVHHADPCGHRVTRPGEMLRHIIKQDFTLFGTVQAIEHVHQGGLAGTVLTEETVDFARFDDEINVIVGDKSAKPLGDPTEFELHASQSIRQRCAVLRPGDPVDLW